MLTCAIEHILWILSYIRLSYIRFVQFVLVRLPKPDLTSIPSMPWIFVMSVFVWRVNHDLYVTVWRYFTTAPRLERTYHVETIVSYWCSGGCPCSEWDLLLSVLIYRDQSEIAVWLSLVCRLSYMHSLSVLPFPFQHRVSHCPIA